VTPSRSILFLLLGISFAALAHWFGKYLIEAMMPLYRFTITHLDSRLDIASLGIVEHQSQPFVQFDGIVSRPFFIGEQYFLNMSTLLSSSRIPLEYALQPLVIFLTFVFAWPTSESASRNSPAHAKQIRTYAVPYFYRICLGTPLILILMLLDFPLQFIYMLWANLENSLNATGDAHGYLLFWSDFLNGGGLIMLSIAISILAIGLSSKNLSRISLNSHHLITKRD
jgi:hypothetical protein